MKCLLPFMALFVAGCSSGPERSADGVSTLPRHVLACRSQESVATLHQAGDRFQRVADDELASGRCHRFERGHPIRGKLRGGRFTDRDSGISFYIFG